MTSKRRDTRFVWYVRGVEARVSGRICSSNFEGCLSRCERRPVRRGEECTHIHTERERAEGESTQQMRAREERRSDRRNEMGSG